MAHDAAPAEAPATEEASGPPRNLVARPGFPHKRVSKRWDSRVRYCKDAYKQNEADFREALQWLHGEDKNENADASGNGSSQSRDAKFSSQVWFADFNKLVSFYSNRDPRTVCRPAKGPETKDLADATAMLSDRCAFECGDKEQDALAIAEAICRNHGYVRCVWDHYRWLPKFPHVKGEVYLDPDCEGDMKAAGYIVEESESSLSDLLADEEIPQSVRANLRKKKDAHRRSRVMREGAITSADVDKDYGTAQPWDDGEAALDKVVCWKIFSRVGVLPGEAIRDDNKTGDEREAPQSEGVYGDDPTKPKIETVERESIHKVLKPPPEVADDVAPTAQAVDPMDAGRRVYILMVAGFDEILKVTPWPMDHFDRDEFPYVECRPSIVPGLLHGATIFRAIRPYLKIINKAIAFWLASEQRGAKRVIEVEKGLLDTSEREKLESPNMYEVLDVERLGGIKVTEFAGRLTSFKDLVPFMLKMHDDVSGINEAVSGRAPEVEETASAAKMRQDQAVAALSYLENAVQDYHEKKARMRVAALQCYVPRVTEYAPCVHCGGSGAHVGAPTLMPCPECRGSGRGKPLKKGADFWLPPQQAEAWRDDLTLDEIRAEVIVGVEPGSTRTDYAERRLAMLTTIADRYVPLFLQQGLYNRAQSVIKAHLQATEAPGAEDFVPSTEELQQAAQAMQQAAMAGQQQGGNQKSPEEMQMAAQAQQHSQMIAEREQSRKEAETQAKLQIEAERLRIQEEDVLTRRQQAESQAQQAAMAAAPKPPEEPQIDPVKAAEVEGKIALEQGKLELEERRIAIEEASAAGAEKQSVEVTHKILETLEALQHRNAEAQEREAEQSKATTEALTQLASLIAAMQKGQVDVTTLIGAVDEVKRVMQAPVMLKRDETGRVTGAERKTSGGAT